MPGEPAALIKPQPHLRWDAPNRTEQKAAERHAGDPHYLAVPWASHIDQQQSWAPHAVDKRLTDTPHGANRQNFKLHTVCQHVYWDEAVPYWAAAGVTDVWLSHAADTGVRPGGYGSLQDRNHHPFRIHAWPLYAVNIEEPERRAGLTIGKDPRRKKYLASFIGAHMPHYISESRLRLRMHDRNPAFYISITGKQWALHCTSQNTNVSSHVMRYNQVLSDSVFVLCPAGAGRNTIRLWEALAAGAIPVLFDEPPAWPVIQTETTPHMESIALNLSSRDIANLPLLLRNVSIAEILTRHKAGMRAYAAVRSMRCFS